MLKVVHDALVSEAQGPAAVGSSLLDELVRDGAHGVDAPVSVTLRSAVSAELVGGGVAQPVPAGSPVALQRVVPVV